MLDTQVGSYRIVQSLAKGGMGEVYLARHEIMDRNAVVKFLHPELCQNKDQVARFFNEARAAASIHHPGIVDVFDVGYADGRAFIVMEYLRGEPLSTRLERGRLELDPAMAITRQIAGALRAAHERGIVHRDLKPENIYVVPDPDVPSGERVKILDFGVAKLAQDQDRNPSITARGSIFGTPAYMAPEQCTDAATVDHRADLYALGCIVYELLCGTPPFGRGGLELLASHLRDTPRPLRAHGLSLPEEVEDMVMRLLAKDPADRFQSCDDIIEALELSDLVSGGPTDRFSRPFLTLPPMSPSPFAAKPAPEVAPEARADDEGLAFAATVAPDEITGQPAGEPAGRQSHVASGMASGAASEAAPDAAAGSSTQAEPSSGPRVHPRATSATTFFSAGQVRAPARPGKTGHRYGRRLLPLTAVALLAGGGALGLALNGSDDTPLPAPPARAPLVVVESPPDAQPAQPAEQRMLADAERALAEQRWEDAIHGARQVADALAGRPDAEERARAMDIQERARNEQRNQWTYESFLQAVDKDDIRGVTHGYEQLPKGSVYRAKATHRYRRVRDAWLAPKLAQARALGQERRCDRIATIELEVGFMFPESVEDIRAIEAECRGGQPRPEVSDAEAPVARTTRAGAGMAGADARHAKSRMRVVMGFRRRALERFMQMADKSLRDCATRHDMSGSMTLRFAISPAGKPEDITMDRGSEAFRECVQRVIGWPKFPPAPKATSVERTVKLTP